MEYSKSTNDPLNISVGDYVLYNTLAGVYVCRVVSMEIECDTMPIYGIEYLGYPNKEEENVARGYLTKLHHPSYPEDVIHNDKYIILYDLFQNKVAWVDPSFANLTIRNLEGTICEVTSWAFEHSYLEIPTVYLAARVAGMTESAFIAVMSRCKNEFSLAIKTVDASEYCIDYDYTSCYMKRNANSIIPGDYVVYNSYTGIYICLVRDKYRRWGDTSSKEAVYGLEFLGVGVSEKAAEVREFRLSKLHYVTFFDIFYNKYTMLYDLLLNKISWTEETSVNMVKIRAIDGTIHYITNQELKNRYLLIPTIFVASRIAGMNESELRAIVNRHKVEKTSAANDCVDAVSYLYRCKDEFIKNYIKNDERSIKEMYNKMFVENVALCGRGNAKSLTCLQSCLLNSPMFGNLKIKDVKFSGPCTIAFWTDGTKTMVRCQNGEVNDPEKGLAMAIVKKFLGTNPSGSNFYDVFKKFLPKEDESASNKEEKKTEKKPKPVIKARPQPVIKARPQKPTNPKLGFIDEFVVAVERRPTYFPADFIKFCKDHHLYFYIEVDGQYVKCDPESTNWQTVAGYCKRGVLAGIKKHKTSGGKAGRDYWAVDVNYVIFSRMTPPTTHSEPCEGNENA